MTVGLSLDYLSFLAQAAQWSFRQCSALQDIITGRAAAAAAVAVTFVFQIFMRRRMNLVRVNIISQGNQRNTVTKRHRLARACSLLELVLAEGRFW